MLDESLEIVASTGSYPVHFCNPDEKIFLEAVESARVAIVDERVWKLYGSKLKAFSAVQHVILQKASEKLKTVETCLSLCERLINLGVNRGDRLLAVGGGIIQDLATFTASMLFRGVPWVYVPTTLLAQADSCIGGKSSLNLGSRKNQLGNFYPPERIFILSRFLESLTEEHIRSGLGEILKVHLLSGPERVREISEHMGGSEKIKLRSLTLASLQLKKAIIEQDEFDQGHRLILNYGHTFGHALEAATNFSIPHGIAVTLGMDMANYVSRCMEMISESAYWDLNNILKSNLGSTDWKPFAMDDFREALARDKKHSATEYRFILPVARGVVQCVGLPFNSKLDQYLARYIATVRNWLN